MPINNLHKSTTGICTFFVFFLFHHAAMCQAMAVKTKGIQKEEMSLTRYLQPAVFSLSKVMMHDVVNPPAAARYYAYCMLGAYEIISRNDPTVIPLSNFIKQYSSPGITTLQKQYDPRIAAIYCIMETGRLMLPSGYQLQDDEERFIADQKRSKLSNALLNSSIAVGSYMAAYIATYAKADRYGKLSAQLRYTPVKGDAYWYPTPPAYMEAVEPNWKTVRPLLIDSCNQFVPLPPVTFSKDSTSDFYRLAKEVYDVSVKPTPEQLNIASFWDCNPFVVATSGHMSIGFKKISPGGHWMNIAAIAAQKANLNFAETITVQMLTGITIMDAFISCWDEKYRSNRIRPETYINRYINIKWQPLLQTPPFPEYTSGHSVVSTAAAEVLTYLLGEQLSFTDNSEELFEIPARTFNSFKQAAAEAAISRLYGGIHYRDAIENGQQQGKQIAQFIVNKLRSVGIQPLKP
ncbi:MULTISPECIES: vanadium-dependent haloperoxidase [Niastella]|uniref:Vanadium-dependent haloperoxidase n=1 Tax=Niastella soli TaxID=2821487 RepID=A0ABS3YSD1_9BACT|nr:vanadium-dependent haloperoxidase [Niastella soli]MBO9200698.1 vanadium-dependent haloperoxidase [Niastella soli]